MEVEELMREEMQQWISQQVERKEYQFLFISLILL